MGRGCQGYPIFTFSCNEFYLTNGHCLAWGPHCQSSGFFTLRTEFKGKSNQFEALTYQISGGAPSAHTPHQLSQTRSSLGGALITSEADILLSHCGEEVFLARMARVWFVGNSIVLIGKKHSQDKLGKDLTPRTLSWYLTLVRFLIGSDSPPTMRVSGCILGNQSLAD